MKCSIIILTFNQINQTAGQWGSLISHTAGRQDIELIVVDNGSTDNTILFLKSFVFPHFPNHKLIKNTNNHYPSALNLGFRSSSGEIIAFLHNDLFILEYEWDRKVLARFDEDSKIGLAGFVGAKGIDLLGHRYDVISNLLDAEQHGKRVCGVHKVAVFDSIAMIARRSFLESVHGFDEQYSYSHYSDYDISMASLTAGYTNAYMSIFCYHPGSITSASKEYRDFVAAKLPGGDDQSYAISYNRFMTKWHDKLPARLP